MSRSLLLLAMSAFAVALLSGLFASLTYTDLEPELRRIGLTLQHLRPIHETFAFSWVFLGALAVVAHHLDTDCGPPSRASRLRQRGTLLLWGAAGAGILVTLLAGTWSGREYLGYHPAFSALVLAGWLLFAWDYYARAGVGLAGRPVYAYMWWIAFPLFVASYVEGHLYLVEHLGHRPLRDIAVQWKSNGVLVGSFNQVCYGALMYVSCRMRNDETYARSRTAFALFCVGALNTFTNYGHHTYHLPQTGIVHWTSFLVSMLEVILLARVFLDLVRMPPRPPCPERAVTNQFLRCATAWTFVLLFLAVLISVPPLNALIHGTHVVVAHSMGSLLGINSMILGGAAAWLVAERAGREVSARQAARLLPAVKLANLFLAVLWTAVLLRGVAGAFERTLGPSAPDFPLLLRWFPPVLALSGLGVAAAFLWCFAHWTWALAGGAARAPRPSRSDQTDGRGLHRFSPAKRIDRVSSGPGQSS